MTSHPDFEQLEESLWRPETRFDPHYYGPILHPDFFEFGHSGRVWTREQSITAEPGPIPIELPLPDLRVREVTDAVVLITYVSVVRYDDALRISNRSSLWQRVGDRWLLRFHQGTPTTA
jgi:ribonuclease HI